MQNTTYSRIPKSENPLVKEDFISDQMVKWCPGCGNHAILSAIAQLFPQIGYRKENYVVVSGIGCSSRFPYYVNTYGFHGIHGRAAAIASGMKIANPELSIWVNTGDGDSMAIGGNHFIHVIRRNIDMTIMLFNNQIYGLTKGQYSPTTPVGTVTKTSPYGTLERPFKPCELVIGAQGTFFARIADTSPRQMADILNEANAHQGLSVVELLQNCIIFADKTHVVVTGKENRENNQVYLQHGKPILFGKNNEKGIRLNQGKLEVVVLGENGITIDDILVHDQSNPDPTIHLMLGNMTLPEFPVAIGVIRSVKGPVYDQLQDEQIAFQKEVSPIRCVEDVMNSGYVIEIK